MTDSEIIYKHLDKKYSRFIIDRTLNITHTPYEWIVSMFGIDNKLAKSYFSNWCRFNLLQSIEFPSNVSGAHYRCFHDNVCWNHALYNNGENVSNNNIFYREEINDIKLIGFL